MKITPINIWHNGQLVEGTDLSVTIINDNLQDTAVLFWQIQNVTEVERDDEETIQVVTVLSQGNSNIEGEDYLNWDGNNVYPYEYVADQLNLTLITQ